jgi:hypothetical protein
MNKPALTRSLQFNFHDLVTVEVDADHTEEQAFFAAEYAHHQTKPILSGQPSILLRFRRGSTLPEGFTFHQHKLLARWGYHIRMSADRIELDVIGNRLAAPMVHHMLLHPSLRYLSARQGVILLHAGAVANHGQSLIFTGYGGAGKTTTTSLVLAGGSRDWSPHGDDYIFWGSGPRTLAYVTRAHLYRDLLRWVPEIDLKLSRQERWRLEVFGAIRRWSGDGIKWAVRVPVDRLWPDRKIEDHAEPAAIILLERSKTAQRPGLRPLATSAQTVDDLISMNFYEARHFLHLVQKDRSVPDYPTWLEAWRRDEQGLLEERLREIPAYTLEIPARVGSPLALRGELVEELAGLIARDEMVARD